MKLRTSGMVGILLILAGVYLLLRQYFHLDVYLFRSYGLLFGGLIGLLSGLQRRQHRGIYFFSLLTLIGLYYTLGEWQLYEIERGLTLSAFFIALGLACYPAFVFGNRNWNRLLVGNLFLLTGLIFLSYHYGLISTRLFDAIFEDYWPLALIILGIVFLINSIVRQKTTHHQIS